MQNVVDVLSRRSWVLQAKLRCPLTPRMSYILTQVSSLMCSNINVQDFNRHVVITWHSKTYTNTNKLIKFRAGPLNLMKKKFKLWTVSLASRALRGNLTHLEYDSHTVDPDINEQPEMLPSISFSPQTIHFCYLPSWWSLGANASVLVAAAKT